MRFFLAGIMQGSHVELELHAQDYRPRLKRLLEQHFPEAEIYDPFADHTESIGYDDETGRRVFLHHNRMCGEVDVVIAFLPSASMGTAIEMWEAFRKGRVVISVSPLARNWAVKFLSDQVYPTLEDFEVAVASGLLQQQILAAQAAKRGES